MAAISVNGAELHYEVRGEGPPLLLIMGASGYGGVFARLADRLVDEFTVVSYDRRGNGRSPRPNNWSETSPEEQADDAAGLLNALGLSPAAIFGTSSGGVFALEMAIRHPEAVRKAILHEPAFFALFDDPAGVRERVSEQIQDGMAEGGPRAAFERFLFRGGELQASDQALSEVMRGYHDVMPQAAERVGMLELTREVLVRAQKAGAIRRDVEAEDIPMVMCGIGTTTNHPAPFIGGEAWRRFLAIVLDGMRVTDATKLPART